SSTGSIYYTDPLDTVQTNHPPKISASTNFFTVFEHQALEIPFRASDSDSPSQALSWGLVADFPGGAVIDSSSGLFHWTPSERDSYPPENIFLGTVTVQDSGDPPLSASYSFWIRVIETN